MPLLALAFTAGTARAGDDCELRRHPDLHWQLVHTATGTRIYLPRTTSRIPAAAARLQWPFAPEQLYLSIVDYDRFAAFVPGVTRSHTVRTQPPFVWVYQRLHFPGPLRDRHYIMKSAVAVDDGARQHYRVEWALDKTLPLPQQPGLVTPAAFSGCWDIARAPGGGLDAVYRIDLDPGGWIPRWLTRSAMQGYLLDLMTALRARLQTREEKEARHRSSSAR